MAIPFMEYVHPETGLKTRVPWDRERSRMKRQEFKDEATEFFRKQDIARAQAAGIEIDDDALYLPTMVPDKDGNMVVDPIASRIKHSGADFNNRWIPRWEEFCSRPQNCEDAVYPVSRYKPKGAVEMTGPITATPEPEAEAAAKKKRGPGRPRKVEMAAI